MKNKVIYIFYICGLLLFMANPLVFLNTYYRDAKAIEKKYGVSAIFLLAQSAHETGWGRSIKGNMMFGIKAGKGAKTQKLPTWECEKTSEEIITTLPPPNKWCGNVTAYKVYATFAAYRSPKESFEEWYRFISEKPIYSKVISARNNPDRMAEAIATAGYATDPDYAGKLKSVIAKVKFYWPLVEATQTSLQYARKNTWVFIILLFSLAVIIFYLIKFKPFSR